MVGHNEHIDSILDYKRQQNCHEGLSGYVKVAYHGVAVPHYDKTAGVGVESGKYQCHGTSGVYQYHSDILCIESNLWAVDLDGLTQGLGDLSYKHCGTLVVVVDRSDRHVDDCIAMSTV